MDQMTEPGGIGFEFDTGASPAGSTGSILRESPEDVRILTFNVQRDALFAPGRSESFQRILRALDPDIIGCQEIGDQTA